MSSSDNKRRQAAVSKLEK